MVSSPKRRRRLVLGLGVMIAVVAIGFIGRYAAEKGQVFVARRCDSGGKQIDSVLRHGEQCCFALLLDDALKGKHEVEMTVSHLGEDGPRVTAVHSWSLKNNYDQVLFSAKDMKEIAQGRAGRFNVAFRIEGDVVGERDFDVAE
jgi:hypothetical protein